MQTTATRLQSRRLDGGGLHIPWGRRPTGAMTPTPSDPEDPAAIIPQHCSVAKRPKRSEHPIQSRSLDRRGLFTTAHSKIVHALGIRTLQVRNPCTDHLATTAITIRCATTNHPMPISLDPVHNYILRGRQKIRKSFGLQTGHLVVSYSWIPNETAPNLLSQREIGSREKSQQSTQVFDVEVVARIGREGFEPPTKGL